VNEEKTWIVDLTRDESFGFLGFDFQRLRFFSFVQDWIEKTVRRHLMPARKRRGFGRAESNICDSDAAWTRPRHPCIQRIVTEEIRDVVALAR
jgi:hypothetical protein